MNAYVLQTPQSTQTVLLEDAGEEHVLCTNIYPITHCAFSSAFLAFSCCSSLNSSCRERRDRDVRVCEWYPCPLSVSAHNQEGKHASAFAVPRGKRLAPYSTIVPHHASLVLDHPLPLGSILSGRSSKCLRGCCPGRGSRPHDGTQCQAGRC